MKKFEKEVIAALALNTSKTMVCVMCPFRDDCRNVGECQKTWEQFFVQTIFRERTKQWILKKFTEFMDDDSVAAVHVRKGQVCVFSTEGKKIITPSTLGYSDCNDADCFDIRIGIAIAYARYRGDKIPHSVYRTHYTPDFLGD